MSSYLLAVIELGLPMVVLSWLAYSWLYRNGHLDINLNLKQAERDLKQSHKAAKKIKVGGARQNQELKENFWLGKWMWFGGGFYGLTALWTLIAVEIQDTIRFIGNLPTFIAEFNGGIIQLITMFLLNQLANIVYALTWFFYWGGGFKPWWIICAYLGYLLGGRLAQAYDSKQVLGNWLSRIRGA